jgi:hypothetical protein
MKIMKSIPPHIVKSVLVVNAYKVKAHVIPRVFINIIYYINLIRILSI